MTTVVRGVPQAIAAFERRKVQMKVATPFASRAGGEVVALAERARAPKDTGRLAASIVLVMDGDKARVGATVPYDRFVQFGTRYMEAQPYGEEAAEGSTSPVVAAMAAIYKVALR